MRVTLTPQKAKELLKLNTKNRPMSLSTVKRYVREIAIGNWVYNGESIKISKSNVIIDGQHRLAAVVEANLTIETELIFGLNGDIFCTIDQGKKRSNADNFALQGVKNYMQIAAVVNPLWCLNNKRAGSLKSSVLSKQEAYEFYLKNNQIMKHNCIGRRYFKVPPKYTNACCSYLFQFNDRSIVEKFFDQLYSGKITEGFDQVFVLREWLIRMSGLTKKKPTFIEYAAKILLAFKYFKAGKNPKYLRWCSTDRDKFPYDIDHKSFNFLPALTRMRKAGKKE